ncbi:HNH endonuclease [Bradyrhizobium yuanmingense]|uniref:WYL domain-containing protein n=1 Tax=Bradyrhizobium yuanmingense TaxID=108015 RepID=UPI00351865F6
MEGNPVSSCRICSTGIVTDGTLVDGSVFHTRCLEELKRKAEDTKVREQALLAELQRPTSLIDSISHIFFQSRQIEFIAAKQRLVVQIQNSREDREAILAKIRLIYDLWPKYPPDWDERQRLVYARDHHSCSACGVGGLLHLHHVRALSEGGTHKLENLSLLCEGCHSAEHGGRAFKYVDRDLSGPSALEQKIQLLSKALSQRKDVRFRYKKPRTPISNRTVTPRELRKLTIPELQDLLGRKAKVEKESRLCLLGYCHLRKANRTFAVHRMSKIELC